ncbi:hypothetical protein FACS189443_4150 [Planctomycetales bacterium]|nr:hypothetical protein FACS189443_4150 [Planctomycetales bacterium]
MKHLFYTLLILASAGTVVTVTNPKMAEQAAGFAGLTLKLSPEDAPVKESPESKLSNFLENYPFVKKENRTPQNHSPDQSPPDAPTDQLPSAEKFAQNNPPQQDFTPSVAYQPEFTSAAPSVVTPSQVTSIPVAAQPSESVAHHYSAPQNDPALSHEFVGMEKTSLRSDNENWDGDATAITVFPAPQNVQEQTPQPYSAPTQHNITQYDIIQGNAVQQNAFDENTADPFVARAAAPTATQQADYYNTPSVYDRSPATANPTIHSGNPVPAGFASSAKRESLQPLQPFNPVPQQPAQQFIQQPVQQVSVQQQQPIQPPLIQQAKVEYAVENIPCRGTEMVARVGTQVILMCDILPRLRRAAMRVVAENLKQMSEEQVHQIPPDEIEKFMESFITGQYPAFLKEQVLVALIYNDFVLSKSREERDFLDKRMGEDFDQNEVPAMMEELGVQSTIDLKRYLESKLGSSLDRERMLWVKDHIAQQWMAAASQQATGECTYEQMKQFYDLNLPLFTKEARAQWQEMVVLFSKYPDETAAMNKIRWMGNQVAPPNNASFEEIAKANSDGFTASKGGQYDWTTAGSLASPELEQAVFTQPVGALSPAIIRTEKGLHIIRVTRREDKVITPFIEAQVKIREKIKGQRKQQHQEEYVENLKRRFPSMIIKERLDFAVGAATTSGLR